MAKIDRLAPELLQERGSSQALSILAGNVMIVGMMVTVAVGFVQVGMRLAPTWQGGYLVWICLFLALEALVTRKRARLLEGREKIIFRISEWIAIAVLIKLVIYLAYEPGQLLEDLPRWQEDFFNSFFTLEYLLALLISFGIWWSASAYAGELEDLYERELDAEWDELGKVQNALKDIRRRVTTRVFITGSLVVFLAVVSRIEATAVLRSLGIPPPGYRSPVANVLIYFILALALLSLTQFALLRSRWLSQRLAVSPGLAGNWLKYGLAFFVLLAVVVFFLPTNYSLGLIETLRYSLDFVVKVVTFLFILITLPLSFCLSLFRLAGSENTETPPMQPFNTPAPVAPGQPLAWLEVIRSLAFWLIFIGVIFFALRYYLMQNSALWNAIRGFPLFRWVANAVSGLWSWLRGVNRQVSGLVQQGIQRLRPKRVRFPTQALRRLFNPARLSPREKIIFYYLSLIQLGGERGLERRPSQTPYQYENKLHAALPELDQELRELTGTFVEARYSRHPVEEPGADRAASLWERIKAILRSWSRPES